MGFWDLLKSRCRDEKQRITELTEENTRLEAEYNILNKKWDQCSADRSLMIADLNQAARDIAYLTETKLNLAEVIAHHIKTPRFKSYTGSAEKYNVFNDLDAPPVIHGVYDREYLCFTEHDWAGILKTIYSSIRDAKLKWQSEKFDCENFAEVSLYLSAMGGVKAGLSLEPCFGWARSRTHAFNVYRVKDGRWMIWEPQTGQMKGELGECVEPWVVTEVNI